LQGLLTLRDGEWLNADCIDGYLRYICLHYSNDGRSVEYIPTYAVLNYENMKRLPTKWYWDLGQVSIILKPAHLKDSQ
jgi:hypothetical protein